MTDETLISILDRLNRGEAADIIIAPISENVWWGYVYGPTPQGNSNHPDMIQEKGDECFFVKAADNHFAAGVHRLGEDDLHWLVAENYRGKRLLREPLTRVILPFIFATNPDQETQRGTLGLCREWAVQSARVAAAVGFKKVKSSNTEDIYEIDRASAAPCPRRPSRQKDQAHIDELIREAHIQIRNLHKIKDTFKVLYGKNSDAPLLREVQTNLFCARVSLDDLLRNGGDLLR